MTQTGSAVGDQPTNPTTTGNATVAPLTRRARREAETAAAQRVTRRHVVVRRTAAPATPEPAVQRPSSAARRRRFMAPVVLALTAGLVGTMAVPAALAATQSDGSSDAAAAQTQARATSSQTLDVSDAAVIADTDRDGYTATAPKRASTATTTTTSTASTVQAARAATAATYATYTGPTAAQLAASPTYPSFSLDQVVSVAKQYIGTPYVYGGATPAGFDCSGYIMYVYAQFGISLAHSVPLQDAAGTTIPTSEAQPGDVVIFNNEAHDGFYMGNGMIMDAPKPGGSVSIRKIWSSDYHIVRFGI